MKAERTHGLYYTRTSTAATNPTTTPTTTKNAAAPLRAVGVSLPITISLVSTILAISLGARLVL